MSLDPEAGSLRSAIQPADHLTRGFLGVTGDIAARSEERRERRAFLASAWRIIVRELLWPERFTGRVAKSVGAGEVLPHFLGAIWRMRDISISLASPLN